MKIQPHSSASTLQPLCYPRERASPGPCIQTGMSLSAPGCSPWSSLCWVQCPASLTSVMSWSILCWVSGTEHLLSVEDWSPGVKHKGDQFDSRGVPTGVQTFKARRGWLLLRWDASHCALVCERQIKTMNHSLKLNLKFEIEPLELKQVLKCDSLDLA